MRILYRKYFAKFFSQHSLIVQKKGFEKKNRKLETSKKFCGHPSRIVRKWGFKWSNLAKHYLSSDFLGQALDMSRFFHKG